MPTPDHLLKQAQLARHLAQRAREAAPFLSQKADEETLNRYADQEEAKAATLEEEAQRSGHQTRGPIDHRRGVEGESPWT